MNNAVINKTGAIILLTATTELIVDISSVEFFGPNLEATEFIIGQIKNEKDEIVSAARHPREIVKFKCDIPLEKNDMMRVKMFDISTYL